MTLADLKIACLKLMNASYEDLTAANIADYYLDGNLNPYLFAMPESINRCYDRFMTDGVAPKKVVVMSTLTTTHDTNHLYYYINLAQIADYERIARVTYMDQYGNYTPECEFQMEEDTLMLAYDTALGVYNIIYYETPDYLTSSSLDTDTLTMPDNLLRLVPYFVKSELYEEDQPNLAAASRNIFESSLQSLKQKPQTKQTKILNVHDFEG